MCTLRTSRPGDGPALVDLWRRSLDATHHFLSAGDRKAIDTEVCGFLPHAPVTVAVDENDNPHGFTLIDGTHMEALFIDPDDRENGIDRQLLQHGLSLHGALTADVNVKNSQTVGFYQRMEFVETGRSEKDSQGRPYPLIHLRYPG
ncbi:acetyltransferase [Achromobacter sp. 2789STDY5608615]|uniref:acetyltransferase n=1 Tax=Achromobacter sp. 2789STDY5608615 TaxID=1806492 RepID=UPI0009E6F688|nr:acetyltransferase [Achromobacter sp. 2789STDY5608615]